jgi:hypothetical protein
MKKLVVKSISWIKSCLGFRQKKVNIDMVIEENMAMMKEIRAKRINFYRHYKRAESYL